MSDYEGPVVAAMGMFFKRSGIAENGIENSGRWPVRLTHFYLVDDYGFQATNFPETFFYSGGLPASRNRGGGPGGS